MMRLSCLLGKQAWRCVGLRFGMVAAPAFDCAVALHASSCSGVGDLISPCFHSPLASMGAGRAFVQRVYVSCHSRESCVFPEAVLMTEHPIFTHDNQKEPLHVHLHEKTHWQQLLKHVGTLRTAFAFTLCCPIMAVVAAPHITTHVGNFVQRSGRIGVPP